MEIDDSVYRALVASAIDRRDFLKLAGLTAGAGVLAACGTSSAATKSDTLVAAAPLTPDALDPQYYNGETWVNLMFQLYDRPFTWKLADGPSGIKVAQSQLGDSGIQGELVESWQQKDDVTYIFNIRKSVKSHFGNELTADDFVWTARRAFELKSPPLGVLQLSGVTSADDFKKLDDHTLQVTTSGGPNPILIRHFTVLWMNTIDSTETKKHATTDDPWAKKWLEKNVAGFGPYYVTEIKSGESITLAANPNYWQGQPAFKRVIWKQIPEAANRLALLEAGQVQYVDGSLSFAQFDQIKNGNGSAALVLLPDSNVYHQVGFVTTHPPFDNVLARRAIAYAFPYDQVLNTVYHGFGIPAHGLIAPDFQYARTDYWPYKHDLGMAKSLWSQSGAAKAFTLTWDPSLFSESEDVAVLLQTELNKIGVTMTLEKQPTSVFIDRLFKAQFQAFLWVNALWSTDVGNHIVGPYGDSPFNFSGPYNNPPERQLAKQYMNMRGDDPRRPALLAEAQKLLTDGLPALTYLWAAWAQGINKDLTGLAWYPTDFPYLRLLRWK